MNVPSGHNNQKSKCTGQRKNTELRELQTILPYEQESEKSH